MRRHRLPAQQHKLKAHPKNPAVNAAGGVCETRPRRLHPALPDCKRSCPNLLPNLDVHQVLLSPPMLATIEAVWWQGSSSHWGKWFAGARSDFSAYSITTSPIGRILSFGVSHHQRFIPNLIFKLAAPVKQLLLLVCGSLHQVSCKCLSYAS